MLVYCKKTGKVYNPDLEFQQILKDAWPICRQSKEQVVTQLYDHEYTYSSAAIAPYKEESAYE